VVCGGFSGVWLRFAMVKKGLGGCMQALQSEWECLAAPACLVTQTRMQGAKPRASDPTRRLHASAMTRRCFTPRGTCSS